MLRSYFRARPVSFLMQIYQRAVESALMYRTFSRGAVARAFDYIRKAPTPPAATDAKMAVGASAPVEADKTGGKGPAPKPAPKPTAKKPHKVEEEAVSSDAATGVTAGALSFFATAVAQVWSDPGPACPHLRHSFAPGAALLVSPLFLPPARVLWPRFVVCCPRRTSARSRGRLGRPLLTASCCVAPWRCKTHTRWLRGAQMGAIGCRYCAEWRGREEVNDGPCNGWGGYSHGVSVT
jgi:hypothetical protein